MAEETIVHADVSHVEAKDPAPQLQLVPAPNGNGKVGIYESGYEMQSLPGPTKHKRVHVFCDVRSYAEFLNRHARDRETCEILVGEKQIVAGLEPSSVTGDVVLCHLVHDPRFVAWSAALNRPLGQKDFHALVRAQRKDLEPGTRDMLLGALRTLEVMRGGELKIEMDETGYTRVAGVTQKGSLQGKVPPEFEVQVPILEGIERNGQLALYTIEIFVSIEIPEKGGPVFQLEAPGLPTLVRQARREAAAWLQGQLTEPLMVGLGEFKTIEVPAYETPV